MACPISVSVGPVLQYIQDRSIYWLLLYKLYEWTLNNIVVTSK